MKYSADDISVDLQEFRQLVAELEDLCGGKKGDADDFLSWSGGGGGGGRSAADDFLNYNSGGRSDYGRSKEPEYQGNLGSSASDFLAFSKR